MQRKIFVAGWRAKLRGPVATRAVLNPAHRLEPRAGMNLALREHACLCAEALDDRAHEGPHARRGDQHRRLAFARRILEALADERDELRELGGLHREALVLALADDRLGERLLPFGRECD